MKYNKYANIVNKNISDLDMVVNEYIDKGCKVVGNVNSVKLANGEVWWTQTIIVDDDSNTTLGEFNFDPNLKVKQLFANGKKLEAVKLYKEMNGIDLKDAKDWVDNNC